MNVKVCGGEFTGRQLRRHLLRLGLLLALGVGLFLLVGTQILPPAAGVYRHEIVSNQADDFTQKLNAGDVLEQSLYVQGPLHGVTLRPHTGGRVLEGTLTLELLDNATKQLLGSNKMPLDALSDGINQDFVFDAPTDGGTGKWVVLRMSAQPKTPEDAPQFHKSAGVPVPYYDENLKTSHYGLLDNFYLAQNGAGANEMLEIQYLVEATGDFLVGPYCLFAAFLTVLAMAGYVLLFVFKRPLHQVFVVFALGLGTVFMFLVPPRAAPDEYVHIATAYHYSNTLLGTASDDALGTLWVRGGDAMKLDNYDTTSIDVFAYKDMAQNLCAPAPDEDGQIIAGRSVPVFPAQLVIPALGITLARLLGLGRVGLLLMGRLFNLVFYTAVVSRAIRRLPLAKPLLFAVGLLPMSLQLAASFSYDTYVMALGFYLLACCLDYRRNKQKMGVWQMLLLGVVCLLLAPAKSVYLFMLALVFLVRPGQYASKTVCWTARGVILCAGGVLWLAFTASSLLASAGTSLASQPPSAVMVATQLAEPVRPVVQPAVADFQQAPLFTAVVAGQEEDGTRLEGYKGETHPNGDAVQLYTVGYMVRHLPGTAKILLRTLWKQGPLWVQGLLGGRLGEGIAVDIQVSWALVAALAGVLGLATVCSGEDAHTLRPRQRLGFGAIALCTAGATVLAGLTWTPINYLTIFGIQGRYLLPVLPLILLALRGKNLRFARPAWRGLAFAQLVLVVLVQLNAFAVILQLPV